jgi:hypothetical protein
VALWKNIKKGWDKLSSFTSFEVGDGSKISFWHDQWCGETSLKVAFPFYMVLLVRRTPLLQLI